MMPPTLATVAAMSKLLLDRRGVGRAADGALAGRTVDEVLGGFGAALVVALVDELA